MIALLRVNFARVLLFSNVLAVLLTACAAPQPAPELQGINGWVNSRPLTLEELRGKVVLLDFWTYSCVNCIRTLPFLKEWHEKYADYGLVIIGVHTPEFEFEKLRPNVEEAAQAYGLEYPIAQDNDYVTWNAFFNSAWPSKYLIDQQGNVRYNHLGEGVYADTEQVIRELLAETGVDLNLIPANVSPDPEFDEGAFAADPARRITRELYTGYDRNYTLPSAAFSTLMGRTPSYIMHEEYYQRQDADILYTDPGDHANHFIFLQGLWRNNAESITHAREAPGFEDYVAIKFYATSVNAVLSQDQSNSSSLTPTVATVRITLDDHPLTRQQAGLDVQFDDAGNSFVVVDVPRLYRLVELEEFASHELRLSPNSAGLSLFTVTFGAYDEGP